jgi:hypothetical protein
VGRLTDGEIGNAVVAARPAARTRVYSPHSLSLCNDDFPLLRDNCQRAKSLWKAQQDVVAYQTAIWHSSARVAVGWMIVSDSAAKLTASPEISRILPRVVTSYCDLCIHNMLKQRVYFSARN